MIPITCANTSSMSNMPLVNMMMPGPPTGFIPLCMGEPVMYNMSPGEQQGQEPPRGQRTAPRPAQFELPNCLAVKSCMVHQEHGATKKVGAKSSGESSGLNSIKGESGSAMDSDASGEKGPAKAKALLDPNTIDSKQQENYSSSQSLYSFLHSSDEKEVTDDHLAESSQPDDSEGDDKLPSIRQVAQPVLSEPFWNEGVVISESLMKTYQMEELDLELVLRRDREKLEKMKQSEVVNSQLMVKPNLMSLMNY